jgi:hypothetical protein
MLDARCEIEAGKRTNKPYPLLAYVGLQIGSQRGFEAEIIPRGN